MQDHQSGVVYRDGDGKKDQNCEDHLAAPMV
jgi:hypothetical protein